MNNIFYLPDIFSEPKQSLKLAVPLVTAELTHGLNGFIATIMAVQLGKEQLATVVNIGIVIIVLSIFSSFYISFPKIVIGVDIDITLNHFKEVVVEATWFLPIVSILLITEAIRLICCSTLRGLKDASFQVVISVFGFWCISFPFSYLSAFRLGLGSMGIWWSVITGLSLTGIMFVLRLNKIVKRVDLASLVTRNNS